MRSLPTVRTVVGVIGACVIGFGAASLIDEDADKPEATTVTVNTPEAPTHSPTYSGACAQADALRDLELFSAAEASYKKLAGKEQCAFAGLKLTEELKKQAALQPSADDLIKDARRLRASGADDQAQKKLDLLVENHPERSVPADLRDMNKRIGWWQGVLSTIVPIARLGAEMLIVLLIAAAVALLAYRSGRGALAAFHRSVRVDPIAGTSDAGLIASLPTALSEHFRQLGSKDQGRNFKTVGATDAKFDLPAEVSTAFPPAGIIAGLVSYLDRLLPRNVRAVVVTLRPDDPFRGLGLTVAVQKAQGEPVAEMTLWERDFGLLDLTADASTKDASGRYQRLMLPAATWAAYQDDLGFDKRKIEEHKAKAPLETMNWRSYAHFAVGAIAQRQANDKLAQRQYSLALDLDPKNQGARLNLAALNLAPYAEPPTAEDEKRLERATKLLEPVAEDSSDKTPDDMWYRGRYMQALAQIYSGEFAETAGNHADASTHFEKAKTCVSKLCAALAEKLGGDDLAELRTSMKRPAELLQKSILLDSGERVDDPKPLDGEQETAAGYYNLACFYARKLKKQPKANAARDRAFDYLTEALSRGDPAMRRWASQDPALRSLAGDRFEKLVAEPKLQQPPKHPGLLERISALLEGSSEGA